MTDPEPTQGDLFEEMFVPADLDAVCSALVENNPNLIVPWLLMASWLYYHRDFSLLSDTYYDMLCTRLMYTRSTISHCHKYLLSQQRMAAGTAYDLGDRDYPEIVKGAATRLVWDHFRIKV